MSRREYTENQELIFALDERSKKLVVQEMLKSYLFYRLRQAGNKMQVYDALQVPFYIAPPQLGKWIDKGDTLPDGQTSAPAMGYWTNRYCVVPTGFDMLERMQKEHDPNQVFDQMELKALETAWALRRTLSSAAWTGSGGKQPDGLSTIIEKAAPAAQTAVVGGVDKATKAWFRNQYTQLTANFGTIAAGTTLPAGVLALMTLIQQCTNGTLIPSDLITTKACFNLFKRAMLEMSSSYHLMTERKTAEFGFQNFIFDGMYLAWDPSCPADSIYALHIDETFDPMRTGDPRDTAKLDRDIEDLGKSSIFELNGSLSTIFHPNIQMRRIAPRSPYRQLQSTEWIIDSFNLGVMRLSDQGVGGSDNGSRWETWG
jgi:hypothetical protein